MNGEGASHDEPGTGQQSAIVNDLAVPDLSHDHDWGQQADAERFANVHFHAETLSSVKNENRPDRGWQNFGDVALSVIKASIVTGAIRGHIPRPIASRIVGSKKLRDV